LGLAGGGAATPSGGGAPAAAARSTLAKNFCACDRIWTADLVPMWSAG
jgi:hypothetical protein